MQKYIRDYIKGRWRCLHKMNKIKVAVVDSGIDKEHPLLKGSIKDGVEIYLDEDGKMKYGKNYSDCNGHGTAIAGIIKKAVPDVELYSVKILDENLQSYGELLIEAIKWCIKNKMKIINLSLGTRNKKWENKLKKVCSKAINNGIIIVATNPNDGIESYPAIFSNVISVTTDKIKSKKIKVAELNKGYKFIEITPSLATAKITGLIAKLLLKRSDLNFNTITNILIQKEEI